MKYLLVLKEGNKNECQVVLVCSSYTFYFNIVHDLLASLCTSIFARASQT